MTPGLTHIPILTTTTTDTPTLIPTRLTTVIPTRIVTITIIPIRTTLIAQATILTATTITATTITTRITLPTMITLHTMTAAAAIATSTLSLKLSWNGSKHSSCGLPHSSEPCEDSDHKLILTLELDR